MPHRGVQVTMAAGVDVDCVVYGSRFNTGLFYIVNLLLNRATCAPLHIACDSYVRCSNEREKKP